jgi:hypothetical protein
VLLRLSCSSTAKKSGGTGKESSSLIGIGEKPMEDAATLARADELYQSPREEVSHLRAAESDSPLELGVRVASPDMSRCEDSMELGLEALVAASDTELQRALEVDEFASRSPLGAMISGAPTESLGLSRGGSVNMSGTGKSALQALLPGLPGVVESAINWFCSIIFGPGWGAGRGGVSATSADSHAAFFLGRNRAPASQEPGPGSLRRALAAAPSPPDEASSAASDPARVCVLSPTLRRLRAAPSAFGRRFSLLDASCHPSLLSTSPSNSASFLHIAVPSKHDRFFKLTTPSTNFPAVNSAFRKESGCSGKDSETPS